MTTPGRNNGLPATRYTPLVDLEPQLADALLEALRDDGVAAYAEPSPGVKGPYGDVQLPDRPTDRVWVDAGARARARDVLSARMPEFQDALSDEHGHTLLPGPGAKPSGPSGELAARPDAPGEQARRPDAADEPANRPDAAGDAAGRSGAAGEPAGRSASDDDAAWEAIIAGWELTVTDPVPRWPAAEDLEPRRPEPAPPPAKVIRPAGTEPPPLGPRDQVPPEQAPENAEEHYVPPPPPPLPRLDPLTKLAWLGVLGAPLWLILVSALDWRPVEGSGVLALCAFIGGAIGLIYRMKDDPDDTDRDDGAVV